MSQPKEVGVEVNDTEYIQNINNRNYLILPGF